MVKDKRVKSKEQFALSLIWRADSLLKPCRQVKAYAEQSRVKGEERDKESERETG